jgi:hypothetical protein
LAAGDFVPLARRAEVLARAARAFTGPGSVRSAAQRPMLAAENAKPAAGWFPLIAIGQGLYYESPGAASPS